MTASAVTESHTASDPFPRPSPVIVVPGEVAASAALVLSTKHSNKTTGPVEKTVRLANTQHEKNRGMEVPVGRLVDFFAPPVRTPSTTSPQQRGN